MTLGKIPDAPKIGGVQIPSVSGLYTLDMPETAELLDVMESGSNVYIMGLGEEGGATSSREIRIAERNDVLPDTHSYTYLGYFTLGGAPKLVFEAHPTT